MRDSYSYAFMQFEPLLCIQYKYKVTGRLLNLDKTSKINKLFVRLHHF